MIPCRRPDPEHGHYGLTGKNRGRDGNDMETEQPSTSKQENGTDQENLITESNQIPAPSTSNHMNDLPAKHNMLNSDSNSLNLAEAMAS